MNSRGSLAASVDLLTNIPGIGPHTAEKLALAGFDTLEEIANADKKDIAGAIPGLSESKAELIILETREFLEKVKTGVITLRSESKSIESPRPTPMIEQPAPVNRRTISWKIRRPKERGRGIIEEDRTPAWADVLHGGRKKP